MYMKLTETSRRTINHHSLGNLLIHDMLRLENNYDTIRHNDELFV